MTSLQNKLASILILGILGTGLSELPGYAVDRNFSDLDPSNRITLNREDIQQDLGESYYTSGQFETAIDVWQKQVQDLPLGVEKARLLLNLALAHYHLGQWEMSTESLNQSFSILNSLDPSLTTRTLAQAWNTKGILWSNQGQFQEAITAFEQAEYFYQQVTDPQTQLSGVVQSQINQALALQSIGFYRKALDILTILNDRLVSQPHSRLTVAGLRSLGETLDTIGNSEQAQLALEQSVDQARALGLSQELSTSQQSLATFYHGQWRRLRNDKEKSATLFSTASQQYQEAIQQATSPLTKAQLLVSRFRLKVEGKEPTRSLETELKELLPTLPLNRTSLYVQLNFAESLIQRTASRQQVRQSELEDLLPWLTRSVQQSQSLGDLTSQAYALGTLGQVYELAQQWTEARHLTEQALALTQQDQTNAITYQWQWQLGRILQQQSLLLQTQGKLEQSADTLENARIAYMSAIQSLKELRGDLVALNPASRLDFRDATEPLYRQAVSLWLDAAKTNPNAAEKQAQLKQAQALIESLQVEELVNFFRADCLGNIQKSVDQTLKSNEALVYPILLDDRLEIILSRADQPLEQYTVPIDRQTLEATVAQFRLALTQHPAATRGNAAQTALRSLETVELEPVAQELYQWLIAPLESSLKTSNTDTLIFVLDGALRNIPMAALYDGDQYLIEHYSVAITPGLQLIDPQPLANQRIDAIVGALSARSPNHPNFSPLPAVAQEVQEIEAQSVGSKVLLDEAFQETAFQTTVTQMPFPIVHLATHGQFSSNAEDTFILTWDDRLNVNELSTLLQTSELTRKTPIELLILSACETAEGDDRAALGLAGVAVRAGARSTLASLWVVDDLATSRLMGQIYHGLNQANTTKAEAVRQAQLELLKDPQYANPYYWAPFVLVGNWL